SRDTRDVEEVRSASNAEYRLIMREMTVLSSRKRSIALKLRSPNRQRIWTTVFPAPASLNSTVVVIAGGAMSPRTGLEASVKYWNGRQSTYSCRMSAEPWAQWLEAPDPMRP